MSTPVLYAFMHILILLHHMLLYNSVVTYHILSVAFILNKSVITWYFIYLFGQSLCWPGNLYMIAGVYPPLWYHLAQNRDRAGVTLLTHVNTHAWEHTSTSTQLIHPHPPAGMDNAGPSAFPSSSKSKDPFLFISLPPSHSILILFSY